jgi:hypothetical protein
MVALSGGGLRLERIGVIAICYPFAALKGRELDG